MNEMMPREIYLHDDSVIVTATTRSNATKYTRSDVAENLAKALEVYAGQRGLSEYDGGRLARQALAEWRGK